MVHFSLSVHKGGLKPSILFILIYTCSTEHPNLVPVGIVWEIFDLVAFKIRNYRHTKVKFHYYIAIYNL